MSRVLFFLLVGFVAYFALRSWREKRVTDAQRDSGASNTQRNSNSEAMVRCAVCGLHVPRPEALPGGELYYCSEQHRQLASTK